jgi:hypothetical protein
MRLGNQRKKESALRFMQEVVCATQLADWLLHAGSSRLQALRVAREHCGLADVVQAAVEHDLQGMACRTSEI